MDNLTIEQRHKNMSSIRSTNTQLELMFFTLLEKEHIEFVRHPKIFGKPDCQIGDKLLIFVDSDFWHGWHFANWKRRLPKDYWVTKIERNIARDKIKFSHLRKLGFTVLRIWEHQIKKYPLEIIQKIKRYTE
jgi:DNA mismatch endonuclease (patch repair protein)